MPQLSLYLSDSTMEDLRLASEQEGVSLSKYVNGLIANRKRSQGWPEGYWGLYGSVTDDFVAPPELDWSLDSPRPSFD